MSDMNSGSDFYGQELDIIRATLVESYGQPVEIDLEIAVQTGIKMPLDPLNKGLLITLGRALELLHGGNQYGRRYNRNAAKLILAEVEHGHGPDAVAQLIRTLNLEQVFVEFKPNLRFARK